MELLTLETTHLTIANSITLFSNKDSPIREVRFTIYLCMDIDNVQNLFNYLFSKRTGGIL